jgi:hypothetical protein
MERSISAQRRLAFNPEAASFSPVTTPTEPASLEVALPRGESFKISFRRKNTDRKVGGSPFQSTRQLLNTHQAETSRIPMSTENMRSNDVPLTALGRPTAGNRSVHVTQNMLLTIPENPTVFIHGLTNASSVVAVEKAPPQHATRFPASNMTSFMASPQSTAPVYRDVDIDELSASLGLPSAKKETTSSTSPTHTPKSRSSQDLPTALYGNLIGRALNKPLTADSLAHYLKSPNEPLEDAFRAPRESQTLTGYGVSNDQQSKKLKAVPPPPGFGYQMSRMVAVENGQTFTDPAFDEQEVSLAGSPAYFPLYTSPSRPVTQYQHHARRASGKKRPRGYTRTKRTDQGPEPSAADIYPEDAHWTPNRSHNRNYFAPPHMLRLPQNVVHMEDAASWPTPAEVYTDHFQAPAATRPPQVFDIFEAHVPPTTEDMSAANAEVLSLLSELPGPSVTTLINFGSLDLVGDERPLSPAQRSGQRYGVNYYGIGIGDYWQPPIVQENDPFRVRPRDHDGWGGQDWAIEKGWANTYQHPY